MKPESQQPSSPNRSRITKYRVTHHAWSRIHSRGLGDRAVSAALRYGRVVHIRGAEIHAIGRREVRAFALQGLDLTAWEGVQVVCSPNGDIVTAYRNHDFRGLRPRRRRYRRR